MSQIITLKKGFEINLTGKLTTQKCEQVKINTFSIKPIDFHGITRPKILVKEGALVKAGTPLLYDKKSENVLHTSPVSGEVIGIKRGEKRKLLEIQIKSDGQQSFEDFESTAFNSLDALSAEEAKDRILKSGLWTRIIQRPFGTIANPADSPKAIFISCFDTHPLAPDPASLLEEDADEFAAGIEVIKKFAPKVHLGFRDTNQNPTAFAKAGGVERNIFKGQHPIGNVGIQIHHISPINKGELVWTLSPQAVVHIGRLFLTGKYDTKQKIAIVGSEVKTPKIVETYTGANIGDLVANNLKGDNVRIISGNVLTGYAVGKDGFLGALTNMVTVIPEGNYSELFGWILPTTKKLSFHNAFGLLGSKSSEYTVDTNVHGQARSFVMSGAFEKVLPMDIMPTHLLKAILSEDYDGMEQLGIYEVIEEDLALCEFIDVSKHDVQAILREGLDLLQES